MVVSVCRGRGVDLGDVWVGGGLMWWLSELKGWVGLLGFGYVGDEFVGLIGGDLGVV